MNMITPFTALFLPPIVLRETKSISNTARFIRNFQVERLQQHKKERKNTIQLDLL